MTEAPNTVSGLLTKRAQLVKLRAQLEAELRGLTCDIDHIDGCIRLFDPANTPAARKRYATKHRAKKGQMVRFVLGSLREASGPLTSRDIALAWVADRDLKTDDETLVVIRKRVGACLITLRGKGLAQDAGLVGALKGWRVTAKPSCPVCYLMPEFTPQALDSLRQPLETGEVMVARANAHVRYPARVQLVAAMNPCRCGYGGLGKGHCGKAPRCQRDYGNRVSGPLLDRIDLQIEVPAVTAADLALPPPAEGTAEAAARVARARAVQEGRAEAADAAPGLYLNARLEGERLTAVAGLDEAGRALLTRAAEAGHLTARGWTRTLRLARTIADLDGSGQVRRLHVAEALIYRRTNAGAEGPPVMAGS